MPGDASPSPQETIARYFEMWNTGDASIAAEILAPEWVDHAHPEVTGPQSVQQAVGHVRAAQPGLRFDVHSVLANGDLAAAVGTVSRGMSADEVPSRLIWLIRLEGGRMTEMWTYRDTSK